MKYILNNIFIIAFLFISLSGCEVEKTIPDKPEMVVVNRTVPPVEGAVWIDSEYRWDGKTYIIVPAHWSKPVKSGVWVPGTGNHPIKVIRGFRVIGSEVMHSKLESRIYFSFFISSISFMKLLMLVSALGP